MIGQTRSVMILNPGRHPHWEPGTTEIALEGARPELSTLKLFCTSEQSRVSP